MSNARPFQLRNQTVLHVTLAQLQQLTTSGQTPTLKQKVVVCNVFPASGKTLMSLLGANLAWTQQQIDAVVYMVPRLNLASQIEHSWNAYRKDNLGMSLMGRILQAENNPPLVRYKDQIGYAITYSALVANPPLHQNFFQQHTGRVMLILDEAQILGYDSATNQGTQAAREVMALARHAALIVLMTGTPYRADGNPLILAKYSDPDESGKIYLQPDVEASYLEGVVEGYIRPLEADLINADVDLKDVLTGTVNAKSLDELDRGLRQVLCDPRFYEPLVDLTVTKVAELKQLWAHYCGLIGAVDQNHARNIEKYIKRKHPHIKTIIAISDETAAHSNLAQFRKGGYDILITVGMAFIGFDHPPISVVCCLSSIREESWLRQFFARGMRMVQTGDVNLDDAQRVFIIAPNDPLMHAVIQSLRLESQRGLEERQSRQGTTSLTSVAQPNVLVVDSISITDSLAMGLDPENDVTPEEYAMFDALRKQFKMGPVGLSALKGFTRQIQTFTANKVTRSALTQPQSTQGQTALEVEKELRREIKRIQNYSDHLLGAPHRIGWGYTFSAITSKFGFRVSNATEDQLRQVLTWLKSEWLPHCKGQGSESSERNVNA